jgi:hypothetical protein
MGQIETLVTVMGLEHTLGDMRVQSGDSGSVETG